jgi:hypothetical protein
MHEARGVMIADPHVFTLEDSTRHKRAHAGGWLESRALTSTVSEGEARPIAERAIDPALHPGTESEDLRAHN